MAIKDLRQEINDIDRELTALFNKRMNVSLEVAKYKIENNICGKLAFYNTAFQKEVVLWSVYFLKILCIYQN